MNYLIDTGTGYVSEWTEAGMYNIMCEIIKSEKDLFSKDELDNLLEKAENY